MVLTEAGGNPFRPGIGSPPPILAGRDAELDIAGKLLDGLSGGAVTSQGILLYGPRGTGKTALLDRIAGGAAQRGVQTGELSPDALTDRDALVAEVREQAGLNRSRLTGVPFGGIGATTERALLTRNLSSMLAGWTVSGHREVLPGLDLSQDGGRLVPELTLRDCGHSHRSSACGALRSHRSHS